MDNIAHSLVGAAIGRAIGDSRVPAPALLGAIAANAPDYNEFLPGMPPRSNFNHRGITHSLLGAAIQAAVFAIVTGLVMLPFWRRENRPVPWKTIIGLYGAALASHLLMDWLGSYGLRPFLPWSNQRYYGDWVAIVDPFFWLVPAVFLAWGHVRRWTGALGWAVLTLALVAIVLFASFFFDRAVATWVSVAAIAIPVLGAVGWHRHWFAPGARRAAAATSLVLLGVYTGAQAVTAVVLKHQLGIEARQRFGPQATYALLTRPGFPFTWTPVMGGADSVGGPGWSVPRHLDSPVVQRVLTTPRAQAALAFDRFLTADVDSARTPVMVYLRDTHGPSVGRRGFGIVALEPSSTP
ncbi:MAG TPA: metal-dependent hydrolase [Gemmatimonadales bacterium]|nr:metal-dependent hydrolase [Gemmatimonadales bacterium]